jgi:hypothetical protein
MKRWIYLGVAFSLAASLSFAAPKEVKGRTFVGSVSDKMCGAKHMMPGQSDKDCTLECVKGGSQFVLVGPKDKIYDLSDQEKPREFAGQKVKVTGVLNGNTINVVSIEAAK